MMDRNMWGAVALFLSGAVLIGIGEAIVIEEAIAIEPLDGILPALALGVTGGALFGLSGIAIFRRKIDVVSRQRAAALVGSSVGVGAGSVIVAASAPADLAQYGFLVAFLPAFIYWQQQYRSATGAVRTDERMQLLAYKAAFWVLVVIILLGGALLWARELGVYSPTVETALAAVTGIGLFGWYGAFRYIQTHN